MFRNPPETETRCNCSGEIIGQSMCRRITVRDESVSGLFEPQKQDMQGAGSAQGQQSQGVGWSLI